ncbi:MAG: DUF7453 family protein [Methylococcales bacterium]
MNESQISVGKTWAMGIVATLALSALPVASFALSAVALEGDVAPGTGGLKFVSFDEPMVNNTGNITFNADYVNSYEMFAGTGVFLKKGATPLSAIAVTGQVVPGLGTLGSDVDGPVFNNNSTVGFVYRDISDGVSSAAVFQKKLSGPLTVIAKEGDPAPGTAGVFDSFDDMSENNLDDLAFIATYTEDAGNSYKTGVFLKLNNGPIVPIVLNGDSLPGGGTQCGTYLEAIDGPWLDDLRGVAFIADEICGGTVASGSSFIKPLPLLSPIQAQALVLKGDPAPASAGGGMIEDIAIGRPGLQFFGLHRVGFAAVLDGAGPCYNGGTRCGVFTKLWHLSPVACVLGGAPAPGTAGTFEDFDAPASNLFGRLAIEADVTGDTVVTHGIFTCEAGTVTAIALEGGAKPGTASTFGDDLSDTSLSNNGKVVFIDTASPTGVFVSP